MAKKLPRLTTDEEAEVFLGQDLTDYIDRSNFRRVTFEFLAKDAKVNLRVPQFLLDAVKEKASSEGISYQRYIRRVLEQSRQAPSR